MAVGCGVLALPVFAQLEAIPGVAPQCVFGGGDRKILLTVHNRDSDAVEDEFRIHIFQAGSATVAPIEEAHWKRLRVLGGQTVLESAQITLPVVTSKTRFLLKWTDSARHVIGNTEVFAYPSDLLKRLKPILGERSLGIYDPASELRPLLKDAQIETLDLEDPNQDNACGLAILGPFKGVKTLESVGYRLGKLTAKGIPVVCVRASSSQSDRITQSFYVVHKGKSTAVVADANLVADLPVDPKAQLNLVDLAELALNPDLVEAQSGLVEKRNEL